MGPYYGGSSREFYCDATGCNKFASLSDAYKTGWYVSPDGRRCACPDPKHQEQVKKNDPPTPYR